MILWKKITLEGKYFVLSHIYLRGSLPQSTYYVHGREGIQTKGVLTHSSVSKSTVIFSSIQSSIVSNWAYFQESMYKISALATMLHWLSEIAHFHPMPAKMVVPINLELFFFFPFFSLQK